LAGIAFGYYALMIPKGMCEIGVTLLRFIYLNILSKNNCISMIGVIVEPLGTLNAVIILNFAK